ncbi:MAG: hypothetical protein QOH92_914 [Chloroflexota bacterium]|jgi:hypothetical protein|nr:hypothetical protein [Chloroflexota bacterium]
MPTRALVATVLVLAVLLAAAVMVEITASGGRSLPPQVASVEAQPVGNGQFRFFARSGRVSVGVTYRFRLYTHCGLDWPLAMDFDGSFWSPVGPGPASDGSGNLPAGYGNPYDEGTITLISPTLAQYRTRTGTVSQWSRHAGPQISSPCS